MAQLLVRNISESLVKKLKRRAVENGTSAEEEHRRILHEVLEERSKKEKKPRSLFDAFAELNKIAPDFDFEPKRTHWKSRPVEL
jgi:antitoxin FitA